MQLSTFQFPLQWVELQCIGGEPVPGNLSQSRHKVKIQRESFKIFGLLSLLWCFGVLYEEKNMKPTESQRGA